MNPRIGLIVILAAIGRTKQIAESVTALREIRAMEGKLVGTAAGVGTLRFVIRLRDHAIKRSCRDIMPVDHADVAQRET